MTLTEEQREAIKLAMKYIARWPFAYKELHARGVLQAMIDSSEHFTDATKMIGFDLERARGLRDFLQDDCAEVGDVWAEMIAEIERLRAIIDTPSEEPEWVVDFKKLNRFAGVGYSLIDIEIAKKWHTAYRKAQNSNLLRKQEIERLRAALDKSEQILAHKTKTSTHWYEEGLQTRADLIQCKRVVEQQAARIEELEADLAQSEICIQARLDVIDQQAAKIRELEDVHKRSGVKYAKIINELRSSVYANIPGLKSKDARIQELEDALVEERVIGEGGFRAGQCEFWYIEDLPEESCMELDGPCDWAKCPRKHELCDVAYQQLAEEGKIGPDADAKPRSWRITDERKAAIKELSELLTAIGCPSCHYYIQKNYGENITVLRAMLTEADHDKP